MFDGNKIIPIKRIKKKPTTVYRIFPDGLILLEITKYIPFSFIYLKKEVCLYSILQRTHIGSVLLKTHGSVWLDIVFRIYFPSISVRADCITTKRHELNCKFKYPMQMLKISVAKKKNDIFY